MLALKCATKMRIWRNWQTRMVQVHVRAISWRFKSSYPHHKGDSCICDCLFCLSVKKPFELCSKGFFITILCHKLVVNNPNCPLCIRDIDQYRNLQFRGCNHVNVNICIKKCLKHSCCNTGVVHHACTDNRNFA